MGTLFALVLTVGMTNGDYQDVILDIYESQQQCEAAATDQRINGECFPVEGVIKADEIPAGFNAKL
ncbi:DUF1482 family protein [Escherichia coli]|uniref:DUF1482 family protein n=1 Tax=Escherichia coli TaxID=562 RepID=UPI00128D1E67|nr:DUF1482 family protein [Escherichia coli]MPU29090.1 DUF1482 family protein [Escherichia coli]MPU39503.1 DUF1482 family protein [Escherichia coli]